LAHQTSSCPENVIQYKLFKPLHNISIEVKTSQTQTIGIIDQYALLFMHIDNLDLRTNVLIHTSFFVWTNG